MVFTFNVTKDVSIEVCDENKFSDGDIETAVKKFEFSENRLWSDSENFKSLVSTMEEKVKELLGIEGKDEEGKDIIKKRDNQPLSTRERI